MVNSSAHVTAAGIVSARVVLYMSIGRFMVARRRYLLVLNAVCQFRSKDGTEDLRVFVKVI